MSVSPDAKEFVIVIVLLNAVIANTVVAVHTPNTKTNRGFDSTVQIFVVSSLNVTVFPVVVNVCSVIL